VVDVKPIAGVPPSNAHPDRCARAKQDATLLPQIHQVWQSNMQVYGADVGLAPMCFGRTFRKSRESFPLIRSLWMPITRRIIGAHTSIFDFILLEQTMSKETRIHPVICNSAMVRKQSLRIGSNQSGAFKNLKSRLCVQSSAEQIYAENK